MLALPVGANAGASVFRSEPGLPFSFEQDEFSAKESKLLRSLSSAHSAVLSIETKYFRNRKEQPHKTSLGLEENSLNH